MVEERWTKEAGLDVDIGIVIGYENERYLLYRGAVKRGDKYPYIPRPFVDPGGYDSPEKALESAKEQFNNFGGERFVRIFFLEGIEDKIAENLVVIASKKRLPVIPIKASIQK